MHLEPISQSISWKNPVGKGEIWALREFGKCSNAQGGVMGTLMFKAAPRSHWCHQNKEHFWGGFQARGGSGGLNPFFFFLQSGAPTLQTPKSAHGAGTEDREIQGENKEKKNICLRSSFFSERGEKVSLKKKKEGGRAVAAAPSPDAIPVL